MSIITNITTIHIYVTETRAVQIPDNKFPQPKRM